MKKRLFSLVAVAAFILCLGAQPTCIDTAQRACDNAFGEEEQETFLEQLERIVLDAIDDD